MSRPERVGQLLRQIEHETRTAFDEHTELLNLNNQLKAENAKLRELVRDLLHHIEYPPCEGCLLEMSCAGDLSQCDEYFDWLKPRARKLGVEVDE